MNLKNLFTLIGIACIHLAYAQTGCPEVEADMVLSEGDFFCQNGVVTIENQTLDPDGIIDFYIVDWDDGTMDTFFNIGFYTHVYPATDECTSRTQFRVFLTAVNDCGNTQGTSDNGSTITIIPVPFANFEMDEPLICLPDSAVQFTNLTCPSGEEDMTFLWEFGDGTTSTEVDPKHFYKEAGIYQVRLTSTNGCGTDQITKTIQVIDYPRANAAFPNSEVVNQACVGELLTLRNVSENWDTAYWNIRQPNGVTFFYNLEDSLAVAFSEAGEYIIELTAESYACGESVWRDTLEVLAAPVINLKLEEIECSELTLNPSDFLTIEGDYDAITWQSQTQGDFTREDPGNLTFFQSDTIIVTVSGFCSTDIDTGFINISLPENAIIFTPDTTLCSKDTLLPLQGNGSQATWFINGVDVIGEPIFNPQQANLGENEVRMVVGEMGCSSDTSISINVQEAEAIILPAKDSFCIKDGMVQLDFMPNTGILEGKGVIDSLLAFNTEEVGIGLTSFTYQIISPANNCVTKEAFEITIIDVPNIRPDQDTFVTCQVDQSQDLEDLVFGISTPQRENRQLTWRGTGVDSLNGTFNSEIAGLGLHTIELTYSVPPSCDTTIFFFIQVEAFIQADAGLDTTACKSNTDFQLTGWPIGGRWKGSNINANSGRINLASLPDGVHPYCYFIQENTPCESVDTVLVEVVGGTIVLNAGADLYACETATLIDLPVPSLEIGVWEGAALINENQIDITALMPGEYRYTFTTTLLPDGCNTDNIELIIGEQPAIGINHVPLACVGAVVEFADTIQMANQFQWSFCDGNQNNGATNTTIFDNKGICKIEVEVWTNHPVLANERLCTNRDSSVIEIQEPPRLVEFDVNTHRACGPVTLALDNKSIGDSLDYIWRNGDSIFSFADNPDSIVLQPGIEDTIYTIMLNVSNLCAESEAIEKIEVLAQAKADYGITYTKPCSGDTLLLHNVSTGSPDSVYWQLSNGQNFTVFDPPPIIPFTDTVPSTLFVKLFAQNQCSVDSIEREITVFPTDVRALINSSDRSICLGDTISLEAFTTPNAPFYWQFEDGHTFTTKTIQHVFQQADTFEIVLYTEACGFDSMTTEVIVLPKPDLDLSLDPTVCATSEATFEVITNAEGHQLFFGDGDSTNLTTSIHHYPIAGNYSVEIQATDLNGCIATKTDSIIVKPLPTPIIEMLEDSLCVGALSEFESLNEANTTYQWKIGADFLEGQSIQYAFQNAKDHLVTLVADAQGCMDSSTAIVYVRETPTADFTTEIITPCTPAKVLLTNQSVLATGLEWLLPDGTEIVNSQFEAILENEGNQAIQLIAAKDGICFDTITKTIDVFPTPSISLVLEENCEAIDGTDLTIDTNLDNFTTLIHQGDTLAGTFFPGLLPDAYQLMIKSANGCEADTLIQIKEIQELTIGLVRDSQEIELGKAAIIEVVSNLANVSYEWRPMEEITENGQPSITVFPTLPRTYEVIVTNQANCSKSATAFVNVKIDRQKGIYFPNAFTPDGSLHNDVFRVKINNPAVEEVVYFEIFDKNGAVVFAIDNFEANAPRGEWQGEYKHQKAEQGIYVYQAIIKYTDGYEAPFKGSIFLIR